MLHELHLNKLNLVGHSVDGSDLKRDLCKVETYEFNSDNGAPVCDEVMQALLACNTGVQTAYGADELTALLNPKFSEFFECEAFVFPVPSGTAGNGLALGAITPPYGTIFCHRLAHVVTTEGGAPEFYSGGGRMTLLDGTHNKLTPQALRKGLSEHGIGSIHHMQASALCLTQATECGVVYGLEELAELNAIAHSAGMKTHMDGARFSNALVHLNCSPAEMTWKAGVDILTYGTIKNGTMNAEAVITFDPDIAAVLRFIHKRAGHLSPKMRYMSAQLLAHLQDDVWQTNAVRANSNASRVLAALSACPGVEIVHPVNINEVFVLLPRALEAALAKVGLFLRPWDCDGKGRGVRMVMSYADKESDLKLFENTCCNFVKDC